MKLRRTYLEHLVAFELCADALRLPPLLRRLEPVRRPPLVRPGHVHGPARVSEQIPRLVEAHVGHVEKGFRLTRRNQCNG